MHGNRYDERIGPPAFMRDRVRDPLVYTSSFGVTRKERHVSIISKDHVDFDRTSDQTFDPSDFDWLSGANVKPYLRCVSIMAINFWSVLWLTMTKTLVGDMYENWRI